MFTTLHKPFRKGLHYQIWGEFRASSCLLLMFVLLLCVCHKRHTDSRGAVHRGEERKKIRGNTEEHKNRGV